MNPVPKRPKRCKKCKKILRCDNDSELCSYHYMLEEKKILRRRKKDK